MIQIQVNVERLVRLQRMVEEVNSILRANIGGMSSKLHDIHHEIDSIILEGQRCQQPAPPIDPRD